MRIYHLYHSGVAIDYQNKLFVFDYYLDKVKKYGNHKIEYVNQTNILKNNLADGVIRKEILEKYDDVYVFVSHGHSDHYNPVIFEWKEYNPGINYILSDDIVIDNKTDNKNIYYIKKDEQITVDDIMVSTYGSTDQGVSFLLVYNGKTIFHAGDLNWWHWSSFTEEQLQEEEDNFKNEVNKLKSKKIDIAFVPVDPRLKDNYYLAGEYFIKTLKPNLFIPIHFGDEYNITEEFARRFFHCDTKIAIINKPGESVFYL